MNIQVIDEKSGCESVFTSGKVQSIMDLSKDQKYSTWKYSTLLKGMECEFAWVWSGGKTLEDACPPDLADEYSHISGMLRSHMKSLRTARVCLETNCFFDLVPTSLTQEYFNLKNEICEHVLLQERPDNYDFLKQVHIMLEEISNQELNLDPSMLNHSRYKTRTREFLNRLRTLQSRIQLQLFGSKTGRLTTAKGTFPVLNLSKEYRSVLKPNNDAFVELDFNSAEVRTFLALSGTRNVEEDIHSWNVKNVTNGELSREQMKERFFAWLYNPEAQDHRLEEHYDKSRLKEEFWDGKEIKNPFGRRINSDEKHSINYLIQSTTNDIVLENSLKVRDILASKKSTIAFTLHDSIILDFSKEDRKDLMKIVRTFQDTRLGHYRVNVKIGKNFGEMKDIKIT